MNQPPSPFQAAMRSSDAPTPPIAPATPRTGGASPLHFGYIPALDGLRAFSILSVLAFHARTPFLQGGFIGVDIFFVLSGFLITALLVKEHDRFGSINLKHFYLRRALRLLPALLVMLSLFALGSFLLLPPAQARANLVDALITLFYAANWTRALEWGRPEALGHTWSLSIEEQFYILWPLTLILLLRWIKDRFWVGVGIGALLGASYLARLVLLHRGASFMRVYNGLDTRLDMLLAGCLLAVVLLSTERWRLPAFQEVTRWLAFGAAGCLLVLCVQARWQEATFYTLHLSLIALCAVLLVLHVVTNGGNVLQQVLEWPVLVWIGRLSYSLYLWHYPIYHFMFERGLAWPIVVSVGSALAFAAAGCSYCLIEIPFLRRKARYQPS